MNSPILIIPARPDYERDQVAAAWAARGWEVLRLDRFWEPPPLDPTRVKIYASAAFAYVVAQKLGLELVSPPDELIATIGREWTRRHVSIDTLRARAAGSFPVFAKPVVPKQFRAGVFTSAQT